MTNMGIFIWKPQKWGYQNTHNKGIILPMLSLNAQIESILFWKGEPLSLKKLSQTLNKSVEEISAGLTQLEESLQQRGLALQRNADEVALATHPEMSKLFESLVKEELNKDLGKAGLETLSIVLYKGPIKRSEIDYIRGVNSQFILRNLLIRGLVERISDPKDERSFLYKPTFELFSYLGITKIEDLPEYEKVTTDMEDHKKNIEETKAD
jgi:segregation and condensation protein B